MRERGNNWTLNLRFETDTLCIVTVNEKTETTKKSYEFLTAGQGINYNGTIVVQFDYHLF